MPVDSFEAAAMWSGMYELLETSPVDMPACNLVPISWDFMAWAVLMSMAEPTISSLGTLFLW